MGIDVLSCIMAFKVGGTLEETKRECLLMTVTKMKEGEICAIYDERNLA